MKFILVAVYVTYAGGDKTISKVEFVDTFKTLDACKKETHIPFGLIPPGLYYMECVPLKGTKH